MSGGGKNKFNNRNNQSGGTKDHYRQVEVPGTVPYWKAWIRDQSFNIGGGGAIYLTSLGVHRTCKHEFYM
jgi:uncharacterized membrane protein